MPNIRSSADLRNQYNEISTFCHEYAEPVFITKNGKGDLAVMSIEAYEELMGRFELYGLLQEGLEDVTEGRTRPLSEAITSTSPKGRKKILPGPWTISSFPSKTPRRRTACWMRQRPP